MGWNQDPSQELVGLEMETFLIMNACVGIRPCMLGRDKAERKGPRMLINLWFNVSPPLKSFCHLVN